MERCLIYGKRYCNQINYIMIPDITWKGLKQSRAHHYYLRGLRFESDHGMVVTTLDMGAYYKATKQTCHNSNISVNLELLRQNEPCKSNEERKTYRGLYQEALANTINYVWRYDQGYPESSSQHKCKRNSSKKRELDLPQTKHCFSWLEKNASVMPDSMRRTDRKNTADADRRSSSKESDARRRS